MSAIRKETTGSLLRGDAYDIVLERLYKDSEDTSQTSSKDGRGAALTLQDMVRQLRSSGFPVTAIADVLQVERKTVYSWIDTLQAPQAGNEARISEIWTILIHGARVDGRSLYRLWNRVLTNGMTLRELLTRETLDQPAIAGALEELRPAAIAYQRADAAMVTKSQRSTGRGNALQDETPVGTLGED